MDAAGRVEAYGGQFIQRRVARKIEARERVGREHAGAVHRIADSRMLLANQRPEPSLGESGRHEQAALTAAHDERVNGLHSSPTLYAQGRWLSGARAA